MDSTKIDDLPRRRRGRPPKSAAPPEPIIFEFPISHLSDGQVMELHLGYKLLKDILNLHKISSLLEKPDDSLFGFHDYYSVIEKPMWIKEISRKFADGEYEGLKNVIDDVKLVLENFYKFWGRKHRLIKQAYRVEKVLEKFASELPEHVRLMCFSNEPASNAEPKLEAENDSISCEEFHSKILERLEHKQKEMAKQGCEVDSEIARWERELLMNKQKLKKINLNSDLAEIGYFLRLAQDALCLKDISQFEIERMLFIVKESTTLASIMTSLLCPTPMRVSLYFKPIMIYEVWHSLLFKKMEVWYASYGKKRDKLQMFTKYGIEPRFWDVVGESNPMKESQFDELPFVKKACILNTLCTTMFHSNKKIEDYFNTVEEDSLRRSLLHEDSKYDYVSIFSPEIRVYRYPKDNWEMDQSIKAIVPDFKIEPSIETDSAKKLGSQKYMFSLIASDKESLISFMKSINKKKKAYQTMTTLINDDQTDVLAKRGIKIMFDQWKNFVKRPSSHASNSFLFWIGKEANNEEQKVNPENAEPVLGKRVLKPKFSLEDVESSSNDERMSEESVSDWEDGNIRQHRKVKPVKTIPRFFDSRFMKFERKIEESKKPLPKTNTVKPLQKPAKKNQLLFNGNQGYEKPAVYRTPSPFYKKISSAIDRVAQEIIDYKPHETLHGALIIDLNEKKSSHIPFKEDPDLLIDNLTNTLVISVKTGVIEPPMIKPYSIINEEGEFAASETLAQEPLDLNNLTSLFPLCDQQPIEPIDIKIENFDPIPEPFQPYELEPITTENLDLKDFNFPMI